MDQPVVFLVGAERSGTTVLRLMLDHHPQIAWLNEFEYAVDRISPGGNFPQVGEFCEWVRQNRIFKAGGFAIDPAMDYPGLVKSFLEQRRVRENKGVIGASVHRHFDRLLTVFPDARFIHLVRDPRDVAPSVVRIGWAGNVYMGCDGWVEGERCWDSVVSRVDEARRVEIRYEDLLADPRCELSKACVLIGVPFDSAMLDFHTDTTYEPLDPSAAQRWKSRMSKKDIALVESRCASLMESRGYECVTENPRCPSGIKLRYMGVQSRVHRTRVRIKKYGFSLWARAALAKRFSASRAYPGLKEQMDEVTRGTF